MVTQYSISWQLLNILALKVILSENVQGCSSLNTLLWVATAMKFNRVDFVSVVFSTFPYANENTKQLLY